VTGGISRINPDKGTFFIKIQEQKKNTPWDKHAMKPVKIEFIPQQRLYPAGMAGR
jgi:hypothetical protein